MACIYLAIEVSCRFLCSGRLLENAHIVVGPITGDLAAIVALAVSMHYCGWWILMKSIRLVACKCVASPEHVHSSGGQLKMFRLVFCTHLDTED